MSKKELTRREKRVLILTGRGLMANEIGRTMGIGEKTVYTYKCRGMAKLGVSASRYRKLAFTYALMDHERRKGLKNAGRN